MNLKDWLDRKCLRCHKRRGVQQYKALKYGTNRYVKEWLCQDCADELLHMDEFSWKEDNQEEALKW